jgi:hypothetical protein
MRFNIYFLMPDGRVRLFGVANDAGMALRWAYAVHGGFVQCVAPGDGDTIGGN